MTPSLENLAPTSYYLMGSFGFIIALFAVLILMHIYRLCSDVIKTKAPTYLEYRVDNGHMSLTAKGNIYKLPIMGTVASQSLAINLNIQQLEKKSKKQQQLIQQAPLQQPVAPATPPVATGSFDITALFIRPIANIHVRIEKLAGDAPKIVQQNVDDKFCKLTLTDIKEGAYFKILFN